MIAHIQGQLQEKHPSKVVLKVHGVGFFIHIPVPTYETLPEIGKEAQLYTHLHVREDALTLFGFATLQERELFLDLLSVSGIGPRLALTILSSAPVAELYRYLAEGDNLSLERVPGLGKKTVQKLLLELKDKAATRAEPVSQVSKADRQIMQEALQALVALGFTEAEARRSINKAVQQNKTGLNVEDLVRNALQHK
jgi:Holliday junction DNA helicase RuvA